MQEKDIYNIKTKATNRKVKSLSKLLYFVTFPIAAILIAITVATILGTINKPSVDDDYFISDDTKTSISLAPSSNESNANGLIETHFVYTYDNDDNVSGLKTYFEYPDEETAKAALETAKDQPEFKGAVVESKYIVITADEDQYKGLTASDVKQQADALKRFQESQNSSEN